MTVTWSPSRHVVPIAMTLASDYTDVNCVVRDAT